MAERSLPAPDELRQLLSYDPATGRMHWRQRGPNEIPDRRIRATWNARYSGREAFARLSASGYLCGLVLGGKWQAHRVAWAIYYGAWPKGEIDHINGLRNDNRIANLRVVNRAENAKNLSRRSRTKSGIMGVCWHEPCGKWHARITVKGKVHCLGYFALLSDASAARKDAEARFGFHANHGRCPPKSNKA